MRSKVISNNLNPVWNQKFVMSWDGEAPLLVEVWDKDYITADGRTSMHAAARKFIQI